MKELLQQLELLKQEEINDTTSNRLEVIYQAYLNAKKSVLQTDIDENKEEISHIDADDETKFKDLYQTISSKFEKLIISKATLENNNLIAKREVIAQLKELAESPMDSLGVAFKKFNELKDHWRSIGTVPEKHYLALQRDYRFYNEQFFYTIKIFRDLQEHDLKKNTQLKSDVIERLKVLADSSNIKELENGVKNLQNDWDDIGPTMDSEWEKLRDSFKELLNVIYQKIQTHHHVIYESMVENLAQKTSLIAQVSELVAKEYKSTKSFEDATKEILAFQEAYKKIGFAKKKENEDSWNKFRELCDQFFSSKKKFYDELKARYEIGKVAKEGIIAKVMLLKDSYDWGNTTQKIISLQKAWKDSPSAGYNTDNKLWDIFRTHCDEFFNAKKAYFDKLGDEEQDNLSKKIQLISRIQSFTVGENLQHNLDQIESFKAEWNGIRFIPKTEKEKITKLYHEAIQGTLKKLNLSNAELDEIKFNSLVSNIKNDPDASNLIRSERLKLKEELNKLENSISQKENNLLFFAKSKNANSLLDDVKKQLEEEKKHAQSLKEKIKKLG